MKKAILMILFALCSLIANAQYTIYAVQGDVQIKSATSVWKRAKKSDSIQLQDSIFVGKNAHVQILNQRTSQIFESTGTGTFSIAKFISNARKQAERVIAELNKEMYHNVHDNSNPSNTFVGASTRGDEELFTDSLYDYLVAEFDKAKPLTDKVIVKAIKRKRCFSFTFQNNSERGFYINILLYNKRTGERRCAYVVNEQEQSCLYIPPQESISLESVKFNYSKDVDYIVFATAHPYDTNHLQNLLSLAVPVHNANNKTIKVYMRKIIP